MARYRTFLMVAAIATMTATPVLAAPAAPGSTTAMSPSLRVGTQAGTGSGLLSGRFLVPAIVALTLIIAIIIVARQDNRPVSP